MRISKSEFTIFTSRVREDEQKDMLCSFFEADAIRVQFFK
jgi:hypothetical protein